MKPEAWRRDTFEPLERRSQHGASAGFHRVNFAWGPVMEASTEQPVHRVGINQGFWLARTPVTQQQYAQCFPEHQNRFHGRANHPAESTEWHDARRFCQWLNEEILATSQWRGWCADLPTEAQWEYACRAGTETEFYTGDGERALAQAGWYA